MKKIATCTFNHTPLVVIWVDSKSQSIVVKCTAAIFFVFFDYCFVLVIVFIDLALFLCPGFFAVWGVLGIVRQPSVEITVFLFGGIQWRHYVGVGPGARKRLGPHKVMIYVRGSGGFSARRFLNLGSLKRHFLHFESTLVSKI